MLHDKNVGFPPNNTHTKHVHQHLAQACGYAEMSEDFVEDRLELENRHMQTRLYHLQKNVYHD